MVFAGIRYMGTIKASMRLFIAVNFDSEVKERLLDIQARIKAQSCKGNFSRPENLHLTLAFLGETPEDLAPLIRKVVGDAAAGQGSFTLDLNRVGCFRHSDKELWWIGADDAGSGLRPLRELRQKLTAGLKMADIFFDDRSFNVHITLGREIRHTAPIKVPAGIVTIPVNRISLMRSGHIRSILTYTEIFGLDLSGS
jgi:2'-5' RNA ligase